MSVLLAGARVPPVSLCWYTAFFLIKNTKGQQFTQQPKVLIFKVYL